MATQAEGVAHFQPRASILSRSKGHSAAGKAAYNARTRIENERTGKVYSFEHLPNKVLAAHFYPAANSPEWARSREGYWNGVEHRENRSDSQLAMDWVIDLPHQLQQNPDHARLALQDFIRENFQRKGYGADLVFHPAHDHGDERNFHAHLMVGIRRFEKDGSWAKVKDGVPNEKELAALRERMAVKFNGQLRNLGYDFRVDHRSLEDRGIDREPTIHLGKTAAALERKGIKTEPGDINRETEERNFERVRVRVHEMTPEEVETTLDRLRREDEEARDRAQRGLDRDAVKGATISQSDRELLSAVRRLQVTMGGTLGNVIPIERGDVRGQGATFRTEAVEERRRLIAEAQAQAEREAQERQQTEQNRRIQEQLAEYRAGLEAQLAKEGYVPGPIIPDLGSKAPGKAKANSEEREIAERRHIQERLAEYRAGLEAQLAKERGEIPNEIHDKKRAPDLADEKRHGRAPASREPKQDVVRDRAAGGTTSSDRSRSWMGQTGGYEKLPDDLKESAERSYAKWVEKNPDKAQNLTLPGYVSYTQQQEQQRADQRRRGAAERGEPPPVEQRPHPARRMERKLHIKRPRKKRPEDDEFSV